MNEFVDQLNFNHTIITLHGQTKFAGTYQSFLVSIVRLSFSSVYIVFK